jgi:hypothetical protein
MGFSLRAVCAKRLLFERQGRAHPLCIYAQQPAQAWQRVRAGGDAMPGSTQRNGGAE